jgi:hypothetical protein
VDGNTIAPWTKELLLHSVGQLESLDHLSARNLEAAGDPLDFGPGLRGWVRAGTSFLAVLVMLLIGWQFALVGSGLNDPDIWWHLRNAQYLFQTHQLPIHDMYSFTVGGHYWVSHEWLSEIPYYLAYGAFGLPALKVLPFLLLDLIFLLLLYLCYQESRNFKASVVACLFSTMLATVSFGPRTILFGYVYLVILLIILQRFRQRGDGPLWLLPPLFCLWINTHGSWSLGLILFALIGISGLVGGTWGRIESTRWTPAQLRKLITVGAASLAALFINPFGWRLVFYPLDLAFNQKLNITHIAEWITVDFHTVRGKLVLGLIVGLLLSALIRNRRWNLGELLLLLFALYSGLTYVRFLILLGIVVAPVLAQTLDFFPRYRPHEDTPKINTAVILLMIAAMIYAWPRSAKVEKSINEEYPSGVLPYLQEHPLQGNMLNYYLWGGYLGWHNPQIKVFVDSRVDIFEYEGVLKDYLDILSLNNIESIVQKHHIRYVLFPPGEGFTYALEHDPKHWKVLYKDKVCLLFEKQSDTPDSSALAH